MAKKARDVARPILIVEDDAVGRDLLHEVFEAWGYAVVAVAGGLDALRARAAHDPDIVVIGLTDIASCRFIERLKAKGAGRFAVIAYSASAALEAAARAAGADEFIVKPDVPKLERIFLNPGTKRETAPRAPASRKASARRG
jgi:CheY-like chemotaxis protein